MYGSPVIPFSPQLLLLATGHTAPVTTLISQHKDLQKQSWLSFYPGEY